MTPTQDEYDMLRSVILAHEYLYRIKSCPVFTDEHFDKMMHLLDQWGERAHIVADQDGPFTGWCAPDRPGIYLDDDETCALIEDPPADGLAEFTDAWIYTVTGNSLGVFF